MQTINNIIHDHWKLLLDGTSSRVPQFRQKLDSRGLAVLHFGHVKTSSLSGKTIWRSLSAIGLILTIGQGLQNSLYRLIANPFSC